MATSSITKNFIVSGKEQVELFANAIEESYQESLSRKPSSNLKVTYLERPKEVRKFMERRKELNAQRVNCI